MGKELACSSGVLSGSTSVILSVSTGQRKIRITKNPEKNICSVGIDRFKPHELVYMLETDKAKFVQVLTKAEWSLKQCRKIKCIEKKISTNVYY